MQLVHVYKKGKYSSEQRSYNPRAFQPWQKIGYRAEPVAAGPVPVAVIHYPHGAVEKAEEAFQEGALVLSAQILFPFLVKVSSDLPN